MNSIGFTGKPPKNITPVAFNRGENLSIDQMHGESETKYKLRLLSSQEITEKDIAAWSALESHSLEDNANLSPYFVLPAIKNFEKTTKILIIFIDRVSCGIAELTGVGIFKFSPPNKHFPLPHLSMFDIAHTSLCGLLVNRDFACETIQTIYSFLLKNNHKWHGVYCDKRSAEGGFHYLENEITSSLGIYWGEFRRWEQAILLPSECNATHLDQQISKKIHKNIERRCRRFHELGCLEWKVLRGQCVTAETVERFMNLEHIGWKGESGSSLLSKPANTDFFIEAVNGFQKEERMLFTELLLNGQVISSTSSFISGRSCFCFKLGWDPEYAKLSPGTLNLINWVKYGSREFKDLDYIDSGAAEDSFVNEIWTRQRTLYSGAYSLSLPGKLVLPSLCRAHEIKRMTRTWINKLPKTVE